MSKFQELSLLIWSVTADVLRGVFKPKTEMDQFYQHELRPCLTFSWPKRTKYYNYEKRGHSGII